MNVAARRSSSRNSSNLNGASVLLDVALRLLIGAEGDNDIASNFLLNFLFAKSLISSSSSKSFVVLEP